jgi:hypothetical protein
MKFTCKLPTSLSDTGHAHSSDHEHCRVLRCGDALGEPLASIFSVADGDIMLHE